MGCRGSKKTKKFPGKDVPDEADELMIRIVSAQLRADYRKSLGKEHSRRSWDLEIERAIKKRGEKKKGGGERED
jgi:hypothetical protein